jgi:phospholipid/cholesterol/gamma-HCH transport system substrate-binding protein
MKEFEDAVASGEFNLKEITSDVMPTMNNTLLQMQLLMVDVEKFLEHYETSPSDIIYKKQAIKKAPGE